MINLFSIIKRYFLNPCTECKLYKEVNVGHTCRACDNYEYSLVYEIDNYDRDRDACIYTFSNTGTAKYEDEYIKKCLDAMDEADIRTLEDILKITREYDD